jgi:hypothetical protein
MSRQAGLKARLYGLNEAAPRQMSRQAGLKARLYGLNEAAPRGK